MTAPLPSIRVFKASDADFDTGPHIGTSLRGILNITYADLVRVFGRPDPELCDGDKTDAEWIIMSPSGIIATIYNYKDGRNYLGKAGLPKTRITEWHIGGHSGEAVALVTRALAAAGVPFTLYREDR